ncbi:MAG: AraC family transcriptional regulator, partial [Bacteroidota bacterium]
MHNSQVQRYKTLLNFLEANFTEDIDIPQIEAVCHYSYRNINRIFQAIHQETIGKFIKRLRLEKAAQYLIYSDAPVAQIAYDVGFVDRSAFSKAFKNKYGSSPLAFREKNEQLLDTVRKSFLPDVDTPRQKLSYAIEYLPTF